jgi:hypothetical protein
MASAFAIYLDLLRDSGGGDGENCFIDAFRASTICDVRRLQAHFSSFRRIAQFCESLRDVSCQIHLLQCVYRAELVEYPRRPYLIVG